jgi:SAM-dependent methyltransferase
MRLASVRDYFETMNDIIVKDIGLTYQVGTARGCADDVYAVTNRLTADRAGLQPGMHVLDAGCGTCGPAVDIVEYIGNLTIDAVTLSPAQAATARHHIKTHNVGDRVRVCVADYHQLPFPDHSFDAAYLLESAIYSTDLVALFQELSRVLRPAGVLYVKDVFVEEGGLSEVEAEALAASDATYRCTSRPMSQYLDALDAAGFTEIHAGEPGLWDHALFERAMVKFESGKIVTTPSGAPELTDFGRAHLYQHAMSGVTPLYACDLRASRPAVPG